MERGSQPDRRVARGGLREDREDDDRGTLPEPPGSRFNVDRDGRGVEQRKSRVLRFHVVER